MTAVTMKHLAELCGVSRGTVNRVLNHRPGVNPETAARVRALAKKLGFEPNAVGRALVAFKHPVRIGVVLSPDYNPFVSGLRSGLAQASRELVHLGVRIDVRPMLTLEPGEQVAILSSLMETGVNAIALLPIEAPEVAAKVRAIIAAGVPVVTFNSDLSEAGCLCFVGQDHLAGGRVAGSLMGRMVQSGRVGLIASSHHLRCHVLRSRGFKEKLAAAWPWVSVVATEENEDRDDLAEAQALHLCRTEPELCGIYLTGGGAAGLGRALRQAGAAGRVRVVTHDFVPSTVQLLKERVFDFAIGQDPVAQGYLPIKILHAYLTSKKRPLAPFVPTRIDIRTDDNIDDVELRAPGEPPEARPAGKGAAAAGARRR